MAKISIISPKLILEKTWEWLGNKTNSLIESQPESQTIENNLGKNYNSEIEQPQNQPNILHEDTTQEKGEQKKFVISLQEMKIISAALMHFHKYLIKKGDTLRAQEVEVIDRKICDFIHFTEKVKEHN
ncbi:MAG: hypothetical protein NZ551_02715 [Microscillaceae bacterium]|nr:hypothetical protein [Microscillaceae bacterium]MDW8460099.1 hypothetical protein [Cytophagales bacterium]